MYSAIGVSHSRTQAAAQSGARSSWLIRYRRTNGSLAALATIRLSLGSEAFSIERNAMGVVHKAIED
jgi:hypothetical protein